MPTVESIAQTKAGLRQLQLISTLTEAEPLDGNGQVGVSALYEEARQRGVPRQSVTSDLEALQDKGWLWFERSPAGIQTVVLKQPGVDAAEEFKALRNDRRRRTLETRQAILSWLYALYVDGEEAAEINSILDTDKGSYFDDPYTPRELARAAEWLVVEGLIRGYPAFGGVLGLPTMTNRGIEVMEAEETTPEPVSRGGDVYNIHNTGAFNWAHHSSNITQSNTLTQGQVEQVERTIGSVRAMLTPQFIGVSEDAAAEGQVIVGQLEEEIRSSAPSSGKVKALLMKLMDLAATGTVQGGVDALSAMMQQGINGIG
ncbi:MULTISPECIES: hypothetical protein [unclassified Pseudarthrobacter]|uniref:hypothetical protein n=1 Tax=unclassified Pseudarthrobacter TaxID=2647000 RepID=UPI0030771493